MRWLVTGASGQLGGYLLRHLRDRGDEVIGWSGSTRGDGSPAARTAPVKSGPLLKAANTAADGHASYTVNPPSRTTHTWRSMLSGGIDARSRSYAGTSSAGEPSK